MIGAETFSKLLDWEDRGTCVLFGDALWRWAPRRRCRNGPGILASRSGRLAHKDCVRRWRPATPPPSASCAEGPRGIRTPWSISPKCYRSSEDGAFPPIARLVCRLGQRQHPRRARRKLGLDPERMVMTVDGLQHFPRLVSAALMSRFATGGQRGIGIFDAMGGRLHLGPPARCKHRRQIRRNHAKQGLADEPWSRGRGRQRDAFGGNPTRAIWPILNRSSA